MRLEISLDKELKLMSEYSISGEEWMFLRALFIAVEEEKPEYLKVYLLECSKLISTQELLKSLQEKKIIAKEYKIPKVGEKFILEDVEFSKSFMNKVMKTSNSAGIELMRTYPAYLTTNGGTILHLRNIVAKGGYTDEDDFYFAYGKKIKFSKETHERVLKALEFGKQADLIKYGIVEFVASSKWIELEETMQQNEIGKFVMKIDNTELI